MINKFFTPGASLLLLLGVLLLSSVSATLDCPYNATAQKVADRIIDCVKQFDRFGPHRTEPDCLGIMYHGNKLVNAKPCSQSFNEVVEEILARESSGPTAANARVEAAIRTQADFCAHPEAHLDQRIENMITLRTIKFGELEFKLYVYKKNDYVSKIIIQKGTWETEETTSFLRILEKYENARNITDRKKMLLLDGGANIGWYSIIFGLKGYKAVAIEPNPDNVYILRKNLCMNPKAEVLLLNVGLGNKDKVCPSYSEPDNYGTTMIYCDAPVQGTSKIFRGYVEIVRLDNFADMFPELAAIKLDLEGYELFTMHGGKRMLTERRVPFIQTSFHYQFVSYFRIDPDDYMRSYANAGYTIRPGSWEADPLPLSRLAEARERNICLIHKDAF